MSVPFSIGPKPRLTAAAVAVLAAMSVTSSLAGTNGPLDAFLPKSGKIEGHIMRLGVAPEDQAIDKQFRLAVQNNMDWFKKYVTGQKSGGPLPYDRRMGVTEAQYEKLQHMKADFQPGEPVEINVTHGVDGAISFTSKDGKVAELTKITFPPDGKVAVTPYGQLAIFNAIRQTNANAPIGVWTGAEWAKVEASDAPLPSAKIAFGKREPSGEGVMYYQIAAFKDHAEQSLVIFYKLD